MVAKLSLLLELFDSSYHHQKLTQYAQFDIHRARTRLKVLILKRSSPEPQINSTLNGGRNR